MPADYARRKPSDHATAGSRSLVALKVSLAGLPPAPIAKFCRGCRRHQECSPSDPLNPSKKQENRTTAVAEVDSNYESYANTAPSARFRRVLASSTRSIFAIACICSGRTRLWWCKTPSTLSFFFLCFFCSQCQHLEQQRRRRQRLQKRQIVCVCPFDLGTPE
ncbi:hypothetical protein VTK73DRAFT_206 [Phialemonium thermophilum]|uniref:Uncharacterized protein n=1 Tax=Phialemonium thermophilum TaxID=223376 RepID=A0ABR3VWF2_9PEZI